jgi:hypothetical protein
VRWNRGQKDGVPESLDQADPTLRVPLPPEETGPVPISRAHAQTRWFGVPPPLVLLFLTVGSFLASLVLLARGSWSVGAILLGLSAILLSAFLEVAHRRPDSTLTRLSVGAADGARSRAMTSFELLRARSRAVAATQHERAERAVIESERRAVRLRLAEAQQSEDEVEADALRERLVQLDRAEERLRVVLQERLARAEERIRRIRLAGAQTMVVPPQPEPYPPPDEGTPPTPAPVPEPYPPPDEEDSRRPAA